MTVQELIDILMAVDDKTVQVQISLDDGVKQDALNFITKDQVVFYPKTSDMVGVLDIELN